MTRTFALLLFISSSVCFGQNYPTDCLDSLDIPTVYTPNGDGINQCFFIDFPCPPEKYELTIFDRWGETIFSSAKPDECWYATTQDGKPCEAGVYVYRLSYTFLGEAHNLTGHITLIR